jgi:hypothetical protein
MATLASRSAPVESTRFFTIMAFVMALVILAGFSANLLLGRSSFGVPWQYHVHGVIFMGWIGLYLAQHLSIAGGNIALHRRLGQLAYAYVPLMLAAGTLIGITVARRNGGPFFFAVNEFLVSNIALLWCFGGLAFWALRARRYSGWHRRLMLVAMSVLTGPGLGRLLPMPLLIPNAWTISVCCTLIFPLIGMLADRRISGRVHPAYWWGLGTYVGVFVVSMLLAYSPVGYALTEWVIAGTPGTERPMEAFLPPGFSM